MIRKIIKGFNEIREILFIFLKNYLNEKDVRYAFNVSLFHLLWETKCGKFIIRKLDGLKIFYPVFIEIEVTTRCNLKCIICEHTYWNEPVRDMSFEEFKKIVDQFPYLCWIGLTGIGESFLNKDFIKMLEYVKKKKIFVELYDTFYFIDGKIAEKLIKIKIDRIFASIDAAEKDTYEKIRVGSDFNKVLNNIEYLFKLKKDRNSKYPIIDFHFIVNKINYNQIPKFIEMVDKIRYGFSTTIQFTKMLHNFPEIENLFTEISPEIIKDAEVVAKNRKVTLVWNQNVPIEKP
ncbi:MAG: radical SAM protein, partial [Candidatus Ratteibacteria bacterium]